MRRASCQGHGLGIARAGEATHADLVAILNESGSFFGAHDAIVQGGVEDTRGGGDCGRRHSNLSDGEHSGALTATIGIEENAVCEAGHK